MDNVENNTSIQIYGDSILKRILFSETENRYLPLNDSNYEELEKRYGLSILNRSKFGCTIEKGEQILNRTLSRYPASNFAVLEFGGNDCDYDWEIVAANPRLTHAPHTPFPLFLQVYRRMIKALRERGTEPVLMTLPPLHAAKYIKWIVRSGLEEEAIVEWMHGDIQHLYRYHEMYSDAAFMLAQENNCLLIDVRSAFLSRRDYPDLICVDGIHPNEKGHRVIYEACDAFAQAYFQK